MTRLLVLLTALALTGPVIAPASAGQREIGDTRVFATVPPPGQPEGMAVRDGLVYVGTHTSLVNAHRTEPSMIFVYDLDGEIVRSWEIRGQTTDAAHGVLGMVFDGDGRLYVVDRNPPRILRFDLSTDPPTQETYATIPDLPACHSAPPPCAPTLLDQAAFPDDLAFDADGALYVTELEAATIFRIPPGGGEAEIWFQDARLDGIFGPNGIAVGPEADTLYFSVSMSQDAGSATQGMIYTLPLGDAPEPGDLTVFHAFGPADGPDGIRFGASGKLYAALAGSNGVAILTPDGQEETRFPATAVDNHLGQDVPYDLPAAVRFDGRGSLLVTNQSFFLGMPLHWVVLDAWVEDTEHPEFQPLGLP